MGIAVLGLEQVQHGDRRGLSSLDADNPNFSPENLFYNVLNPRAARDNNLQSAAELFQAVRLIENFPESERIEGILDPKSIYFFGHSQGTQGTFVGAAFEPRIKGFVLSGVGGLIIESLLGKKKPMDVSNLLSLALMDPEVDRFHPVLNLVQAAFDSVDPAVYAPMMFWNDMSAYGIERRSVFMSSGVNDNYTPDNTHQIFANAGKLLQSVTSGEPLYVPEIEGGLPHAETYTYIPETTGVVVRYEPTDGRDGHFVMFEHPAAIAQADAFIQSMVAAGTAATLSPPP